jgi:hypothetical protein
MTSLTNTQGALLTKEVPLKPEEESMNSLRTTRKTLLKIMAIAMVLAGSTAAVSVLEKYDSSIGQQGRIGCMAGVQGLFVLMHRARFWWFVF